MEGIFLLCTIESYGQDVISFFDFQKGKILFVNRLNLGRLIKVHFVISVLEHEFR
jgi:hypothetical protein